MLNPSINHPVHSFLNLSIHPSRTVCLFTHSLINPSTSSFHQFIHPNIQPAIISLSICQFVHQSSIHEYPFLPFLPFSSSIHLSISKSVHSSVSVSVKPFICLSNDLSIPLFSHPSMKHLAFLTLHLFFFSPLFTLPVPYDASAEV